MCRDTFLAQVVIEGLEWARFDGSLVAVLEQDIEMAARAARGVQLTEWEFEPERTTPRSPLLDLPEASDCDGTEAVGLQAPRLR